jgi:exoribonuclease II
MDRRKVAEKAANWWTELICKYCSATIEDEKVRAGFFELHMNYNAVYCDESNQVIDTMFKKYNLPYCSQHHCPKQAGSRIVKTVSGQYALLVKAGYNKPEIIL